MMVQGESKFLNVFLIAVAFFFLTIPPQNLFAGQCQISEKTFPPLVDPLLEQIKQNKEVLERGSAQKKAANLGAKVARMAESAERRKKRLGELARERRSVLCSLEESDQEIQTKIRPLLKQWNCPIEEEHLKSIQKQMTDLKKLFSSIHESDQLENLLLQFDHGDFALVGGLESLKIRLSWPQVISGLDNELKSMERTPRLSKLADLVGLKNEVKREQQRISGFKKDQCPDLASHQSSFLRRSGQFLKGLAREIGAKQGGESSRPPFTNFWVTFSLQGEKDEPLPLMMFQGGEGQEGQPRILFLYARWGNESFDTDTVLSRAQIEQRGSAAQSIFRQSSYGRFVPQFDICTMATTFDRPPSGREERREIISLCDGEVDYSLYDYLVFYQRSRGGGKYWGRQRIYTDDGEFRLPIIRVALTSGASTIVHEIGHALTLEHAHDLNCGPYVFGGEFCDVRSDYGDPYDPMGSGSAGNHYNCVYKEKIGWSGNSIVHRPGETEYVLGAIEADTPNPQCLAISIDPLWISPDMVFDLTPQRFSDNPCEKLYIEYRKPIGVDTVPLLELEDAGLYENVHDGLLAFHCSRKTAARTVHSWLLDCGVRRHSQHDALLPPSQVCHTGLGFDISFEPLEANSARVQLSPSSEYYCDGRDDNQNGVVDESCDDDRDGYCDNSMVAVAGTEVNPCPQGGGDCFDLDASRICSTCVEHARDITATDAYGTQRTRNNFCSRREFIAGNHPDDDPWEDWIRAGRARWFTDRFVVYSCDTTSEWGYRYDPIVCESGLRCIDPEGPEPPSCGIPR